MCQYVVSTAGSMLVVYIQRMHIYILMGVFVCLFVCSGGC